jgi:hypothetical protein
VWARYVQPRLGIYGVREVNSVERLARFRDELLKTGVPAATTIKTMTLVQSILTWHPSAGSPLKLRDRAGVRGHFLDHDREGGRDERGDAGAPLRGWDRQLVRPPNSCGGPNLSGQASARRTQK